MNLYLRGMIPALLLAVVTTCYLCGCGSCGKNNPANNIERSAPDVSLFLNDRIKLEARAQTAAVLDFTCTVVWDERFKTEEGQLLRKNIAIRNREKMEASLLQAGFNLIARDEINKIIEEQAGMGNGISENTSEEIGRLLNADIVVFGAITQWNFWESSNTGFLEIITNGIHVNTGEVFFKGTINHNFVSAYGNARYDFSVAETRGFEILGERLKSGLNFNSGTNYLNYHYQDGDEIDADNINIDLFVNKNIQFYGVSPVIAVLDISAKTGLYVRPEAAVANIELSQREKMENALLQNGFQLVDRARINALLEERGFSEKGVTENNYRTIGERLEADIIIAGIVSVGNSDKGTPYCKGGITNFLEVLINGISVPTGEVVFKGIVNHRHCSSSEGNRCYSIIGEKLKPLLQNKE